MFIFQFDICVQVEIINLSIHLRAICLISTLFWEDYPRGEVNSLFEITLPRTNSEKLSTTLSLFYDLDYKLKQPIS